MAALALVWCETARPDLAFAKRFAEALHASFPGKMLAYNCSPSFKWKKDLDGCISTTACSTSGQTPIGTPIGV
jgi:isocitrate lyase